MAVAGPEGAPARLVVQQDANLAGLASGLKVGQNLSGRITDILADGRAVVNFRGFAVTAELKGVALKAGETIAVVVQDLKGTPVFRIVPRSAAAVAPGKPAEEAGAGAAARLGLPQDAFHETLVKMLGEYGLKATREAAMAVKDVLMSGVLGAGVAGSTQAIETAVFMHAHGMPANSSLAAAVKEYLYGSARLPEVLAALERHAAGPLPREAAEAVGRVLAAGRALAVDPAAGSVPEQLRAAVEGMGLEHESGLARASGGQVTALEAARGTLKSALLDLAARIEASGADGLRGLKEAALDALRVVEAQQVGSQSQKNASVVYVQIPVATGGELGAGDIQVAWRRERDGRGRDPKKPAHMTLVLETRSLGAVEVAMRVLGKGVSLTFTVPDRGAEEFIRGELPELVRRLTGLEFRMNQVSCESADGQAGPAIEAAPPTSSLDLKA